MSNDIFLEMRKFVAPEFVFGQGAAGLAGQYARNLGSGKVLVVSDPGVKEAGWTDLVVDSVRDAGLSAELFLDISPNPRDHQVMAGAEMFKATRCDAIVVVGGGSPMDCAKGIGIVSTNNRHILEFEGVDQVERPGPPLVCIPTTSGSSADVSQFAIVSDTTRKVKIAIVSKKTVPDASLIDPLLTTTMDANLTANTGLDALTHAFEAYVSNANGPVTDLHALEAVRRIFSYLGPAIENPDDLTARAGMCLGSLHAGLAFSNAILGAVHAMAHALGGLLDLPHGQCNAILLDHVVAYNFQAEPERYRALGRALGACFGEDAPPAEAEAATLDALRAFKRRLGVNATLSELGVTREDIPNLAKYAMADPCIITNPRAPSQGDVEAIFENAL